MLRKFFVLSAMLVAAGCEQESQSLPFDVNATTTSSVSTQGGVVSSPGGASVSFPQGAVSGTVQVSVAPSTVPAAVTSSGTVASDAFKIEPENTTLAKAAELELKFSPSGSNAWLASLVGISSGVLREYGATRVDLSSGVAATDVTRLGTFAVVIPEAAAVHRVQDSTSNVEIPLVAAVGPGQTTRTISVDCGNPGDRCTGLTLTASQNILNQVEDAAAVYPLVTDQITISGSLASGQITANAPVRVFLESGTTAETIEFNAKLTAQNDVVTETSTQVRVAGVLFEVSGSADSETGASSEIATLIINKSSGNGTVVIDRDFDITVSGGGTESANVAIAVPVQLNP